VCTDQLTNDDVLSACPCGHIFHERCLSQWITQCRNAPVCPMCRAKASRKNIIKKLYFNAANTSILSQDEIGSELVAFGCGSNANRRLGVEGQKELKPVKCDFGQLVFVDANINTCLIDRDGKLKMNGVEETRLTKQIKAATTGLDRSRFAIDADGKLLTWGGNSAGQLGHGDTNLRDAPTVVEKLKDVKIKQLDVFGGTVACTTEENEAFVWGRCAAFGLGSKVTMPTKLDGRFCHINVGCQHALMLDESNEVYAIGENAYGELGVNDWTRRSTWTKVVGLDGQRVIKIQCGYLCSAILTDDGVYAMAHLGTLGSIRNKNTPTKIKLPNVADISLSASHILAKTTAGQVFAWGLNGAGKCGIGTSSHVDKPTRVQLPDDVTVVKVSAGCEHSIFTCKKK